MKKVFLLLAVFFLLVSPSYAFTGLGLGVRAGIVSNYDNPTLDELFDAPFVLKGKKIEDMNMLGAHLKIGTLPIIDLEISGEYFWKTEEFSFEFVDYQNPSGVDTANGEFKIEDYSVNVTAKYVFPTSTIKPYVGGGGGLHIIKYSNPGPGPFFENQSKPSYHACGGVLLDVPVLPLEVFLEGRYTSIQTEKKATGFFTWMVGVTLNLP
ncbi:MAG TPA: outer membrane beta-barrel protein [candidate division Zixibacteria bacterium]